jgi:hypothetical protein
VPESDFPRFSKDLAASTDPFDPTVGPAGQQWPSDPLPDLELSGEVTGYLCDALLDWALGGRGYPQMAPPDAGPDCDHLQALQQIIERIPQRIAQAQTVADKLDLGRAGRMLSRAFWASWDPQGVQDVLDRELLLSLPWAAGRPAPVEATDGWPS